MTPQSSPSSNLATPRCALAVGAHPDDIEFGCGATLAKWASAGCHIRHLVCTDGAMGSWDPSEDLESLVQLRQEEQRAASRVLGGDGDVVFLGWPDGELEAGPEQRRQLCSWIRAIRPDVVLGHDPWKRYRLHPDHRNAGFLLTDAIVAARDPHFFPDLDEPPHRPSALLLWEADEPDHLEDVVGFVDAKLSALLAHRSQLRSTMGIEEPTSAEETARFRDRVIRELAESGKEAGFPAAEAFKLINGL